MTCQPTMGGRHKGTAEFSHVCQPVCWRTPRSIGRHPATFTFTSSPCVLPSWQFSGWNCLEVNLSGRSYVLAFCKSQWGSTVVTLLPGTLPIREGCCTRNNCHNFTLFHLLLTCMPSGIPGTAQVRILTEESAYDLGSCSPWKKPTAHYLWAVTGYIPIINMCTLGWGSDVFYS
jgi:hypothetical protein